MPAVHQTVPNQYRQLLPAVHQTGAGTDRLFYLPYTVDLPYVIGTSVRSRSVMASLAA